MLLSVQNLTVRYGPIVAIRELSMEVGQGEVVAVLGANGAGKSSLLGAIAGLVPAAAGSIAFKGEAIARKPPEARVRLGLSLTPEGRRVFPRLSVAQNLRLGGAVQRGRPGYERSWERVMSLFPVLTERSAQEAGSLSGGEQQMLAIGRSLMAAPQLLLLDEPSLGLAPIVIQQVFELISRLTEGGTTLLIVEQNVSRALEIADRAYVLETGRLVSAGTPAQLTADADIARSFLGLTSVGDVP